jgi:hypothetical protein
MILSGKEGRGGARRHPEAGEAAILGRFSSFSTVDRDREGWEEEEDNKLVSPHSGFHMNSKNQQDLSLRRAVGNNPPK